MSRRSRAEIAEAEGVLVRPAGPILHAAQNRLREKTLLSQVGLPVTPYRAVTSLAELEVATREIGFPAILKTAAFGYDGKDRPVSIPMHKHKLLGKRLAGKRACWRPK